MEQENVHYTEYPMQFYHSNLSHSKITTFYCATVSISKYCPTATKQDQDDTVAVELGLERMDVKSSCAAQVESYNQCVTVYLELEWNDAELSCVAQVESGAPARLSVEHAMAAHRR